MSENRRSHILYFWKTITLLLALSNLWSVSGVDGIDPRIRVLIVTNGTPRDGHLRFYRSLRAAKYPVQMVPVDEGSNEISVALDALRQSPEDELLLLTNSDRYLASDLSYMATWVTLGELARQEAEVLIPFPALPRVMSHVVQNELEKVQSELQAFRVYGKSGVKPHGPDGLKAAQELLKKLKALRVQEEHDQRNAKPNFNAFRAYAFAGLSSSVKYLLEEMDEKYEQRSLEAMWRALSESPRLRQLLGVATDYRYVVFRDVATLQTGDFGFREGLDGTPIIHAKTLVLPPFLHAKPFDFLLSLGNMATREVTFKATCSDCPDEPLEKPEVLWEGEGPPTVTVAVFVENPVPFFRLFLRRLERLHYPKEKLSLFFYLSENASRHTTEVDEFLDQYEMQLNDVGVLYPEHGFASDQAHRALWSYMNKSGEDYLFMIDAEIQLTNPDVLQDLISKRRNVVSPLLTTPDGSRHNLMTEYVNKEFVEGPFAQNFAARYQPGKEDVRLVGMLHVAMARGALLLTRDAYSTIKGAFVDLGEPMWKRFFLQVMSQGYIPYACNQEHYGRLFPEDETFLPDVWNLKGREDDYEDFYTFLETAEGLEVRRGGEGECEGILTRLVFNPEFLKELMAQVDGEPPWRNVAPEAGEMSVLEPPEGLASEAGVLAKFAVRSMLSEDEKAQMSSKGKLQVLKGSGTFAPEEEKFVVLVAFSRKVTDIVAHARSGHECYVTLQRGETAFFRSAVFPKLTLPRPATLAVMTLSKEL